MRALDPQSTGCTLGMIGEKKETDPQMRSVTTRQGAGDIVLAGAFGFDVGWFSHINMCIDLMLLLYNTDGGYVIDL